MEVGVLSQNLSTDTDIGIGFSLVAIVVNKALRMVKDPFYSVFCTS